MRLPARAARDTLSAVHDLSRRRRREGRGGVSEPGRLRVLALLLWVYRAIGLQWLVRRLGILRASPRLDTLERGPEGDPRARLEGQAHGGARLPPPCQSSSASCPQRGCKPATDLLAKVFADASRALRGIPQG